MADINKVPELLEVVDRLRRDLGTAAFTIRDHWDADLCAIGLAKADSPAVLAYISVFKMPAGEFYLELERPSPKGDEYEVVGMWQSVGYPMLCRLLGEHFGVTRATA